MMLYDDLLEQLENPRTRRKTRGSDRRPRRWEDYLTADTESYSPRKPRPRDDEGDDLFVEYNRRERRRDPHWKRRRED